MMKNIILILAVAMCGGNLLMAAELENIKAFAGDSLSVNVSEAVKGLGDLPKPVMSVAGDSASKDVVFSAKSEWSIASYSSRPLTPLQRLGVLKSAEDTAINKCTAQGLVGCVAIGSKIDSCNGYACSATGMAASRIPAPGAKVFSAKSEWNSTIYFPRPFTHLEQLGVLKSAEDTAINECTAQGLVGCVAISSVIEFCNDRSCSAIGGAQAR